MDFKSEPWTTKVVLLLLRQDLLVPLWNTIIPEASGQLIKNLSRLKDVSS
jgi:hypothetical protein